MPLSREFRRPFALLAMALLASWAAAPAILGAEEDLTNEAPPLTNGVSTNAPVEPAEPVTDSLSQRGSHNYQDMGLWIWETNTFDRQTVRFWKSFDVPENDTVKRARLRVTGDNEYILFLDGRELGRDAEWRHLYEYDITSLLTPGKHILAVEVYNSSREAGLVLGMAVGLASGRVVNVKTDSSWLIVPEAATGWEKRTEPGAAWRPAKEEAKFGLGPWGKTVDYIDLVPPMQPLIVPFWRTGWFVFLLASACVVFCIYVLKLTTELLFHRKEQLLLQRERSRIARDIHDDLGTRVSQLVLEGEVAQSELPPNSRTREHLNQISEQAREALRAMDEILWAINPRRDTLQEFATFLCGHAQTFLKATPIRCLLDVEPGTSAVAFDLPFRRSLLMAVKEALNNAAKHSEATELLLQIHRRGLGLIVVVQDNGKGFDAAKTKSERNGLDNMTQRLREMGGSFTIASQPGKGCRVEFHIPFIQMTRRPWWSRWQRDDALPRPQPLVASTKDQHVQTQ